MNILITLFAGLCLFQLLLVLARFRFQLCFEPWHIPLLSVFLNCTVNEDLHIYFGYALFDVIRWGLTRTEGRTEFQMMLTFIGKN